MRPLRADEIEVRVGQVYQNGVTMLLYKTARTDMAILDEVYGECGWQCDYKELKGNMYCGIGVQSVNGDWVWKWDCGTESNTEREKGEASDAFKRAGFKWGIGRELYTSPFIWLQMATDEVAKGKYKLHNPKELNGIYVSRIATEEINGVLTVTDLELSQRTRGNNMVIWKARKGNE